MPKSTRRRAAGKATKPSKPYHDFPLFPHASGRWAKKIKGDLHYFGRWGNRVGKEIVPVQDVQVSALAAKDELDRQWPYIVRGETPPSINAGDGLTVRNLCNGFITSKQNRVHSGELSPHSIAGYHRACESLIGYFGESRFVADLRPDDFEGFRAHLAAGCNVVTLLSKINRIRVVLKFASDSALIDRPVRYGKSFDRPGTVSIRKARNEAGERMFEADELRRVIDAAGTPLRAMVLFALNAGFGNNDCAMLPQAAVDLEFGWVEFPRPKTAVRRRCPMWPETVHAVREAIERRPQHKDPADAGLCFLTSRRTRVVRVRISRKSGKYQTVNSLARRFEGLLDRLGIERRRGLGFSTLRHVFETIGGESRDQVAVDAIMGHVDPSMGGQYRERISDDRLRDVTESVRRWLWPTGPSKPAAD